MRPVPICPLYEPLPPTLDQARAPSLSVSVIDRLQREIQAGVAARRTILESSHAVVAAESAEDRRIRLAPLVDPLAIEQARQSGLGLRPASSLLPRPMRRGLDVRVKSFERPGGAADLRSWLLARGVSEGQIENSAYILVGAPRGASCSH